MVRVSKNIFKLFIIALLIITYIQQSDSKGGGRGGRRGGSRGSKGSGGWFSFWFSSPKKSSGSTSHNTGASKSKPIASNVPSNNPSKQTYGSNNKVNSYPRLNEILPGGVQPPPGVKQPYGPPPVYSQSNINVYNNIHAQSPAYSLHPVPGHQSLGGHQPRKDIQAYTHPPPPPGFLNTRGTGGAAPDYTYNINNYYSRDSNSDMTAGLVLWELTKHRPHYKVYHRVTKGPFEYVSKLSEQEEIKAGETYIVTPTDVHCQVLTFQFPTYSKIVVTCETDRNLEIRILLPSNRTAVINCKAFLDSCSGNGIFTKSELTPVDYKIFNETAVYGVPLCNTMVIDGNLVLVNQYAYESSPCVYPPYKWTGEDWTILEDYYKQQKEKIKENLDSVYNVTKLKDKTLRALAHSVSFGKLYDLFYNTTK